jgi:hypothetical protein
MHDTAVMNFLAKLPPRKEDEFLGSLRDENISIGSHWNSSCCIVSLSILFSSCLSPSLGIFLQAKEG